MWESEKKNFFLKPCFTCHGRESHSLTNKREREARSGCKGECFERDCIQQPLQPHMILPVSLIPDVDPNPLPIRSKRAVEENAEEKRVPTPPSRKEKVASPPSDLSSADTVSPSPISEDAISPSPRLPSPEEGGDLSHAETPSSPPPPPPPPSEDAPPPSEDAPPPSEDAPPSSPVSASVIVIDLEKTMTLRQLRDECAARGLHAGGKKAELARRIEEDDERKKEVE